MRRSADHLYLDAVQLNRPIVGAMFERAHRTGATENVIK